MEQQGILDRKMRLLEDFDRLWPAFGQPLARLLAAFFEDGFWIGKKEALDRIWDAMWSRNMQGSEGRRNGAGRSRAFCPALARQEWAKRSNTEGPPARRGTPDLKGLRHCADAYKLCKRPRARRRLQANKSSTWSVIAFHSAFPSLIV